ncbi:MAG: hypothetical protein P8X70_01600 [Nanoarchaeota archaeon]
MITYCNFVGINFNKIKAEKTKNKLENLKIDSQIKILDIKKTKTDFFKIKEDLIEIDFSFLINYSPDIANIELSGKIVLAVSAKVVKDIMKKWENKKISETPDDFRLPLFNLILKKSTLRALQLEEELNLPIHISLPLLQKQNNTNNSN